jgi:hypothetical protein
MEITREKIHQLINELPEQEIPTVCKFLSFLIDDYKKFLKSEVVQKEDLEITLDKLIEKIGSYSTGGNSVEDVRLERE